MPLTVNEVRVAMPAAVRSSVDQDFTDKINAAGADPEEARLIREGFVTYTDVLLEGRYKLEDYLNAVTYVSFKMMGHTNREAWEKTFPDRYQALLIKGTTDKTISAHVHGFSKGKLVNSILERTLIPTWVLNQDIYQQAINEQANLMRFANSELVRTQAANSILTHLKPPEVKKLQVAMDVKESAGLSDLRNLLTDLASKQIHAIENGVPTQEIAHQPLIEDAELVEEELGEAIKYE